LLGFFASWKKMKFASILSYVIILVAAVAIYLGKETGTSGGEISHPEIRKDYKASSGEGEEADEGESEEENED
jgi:hypothetical protein